ncbi:hypothetical protein B0H17DRAFT_118359 [Mycena rosella]|uniref:DUF6534 domain-containing protein n=1 Tax=Mycena rosella TaxID=1033263 RepID=A0AAD7GQY3_MYCRO|nr:hypothetical protein B0H17DRAFT_118359 [Mycena rosella]
MPTELLYTFLIMFISIFNFLTPLLLQAIIYRRTFSDDVRRLKAVVVLLFTLDSCRTLEFLVMFVNCANAASSRNDTGLYAPTQVELFIVLLSGAGMISQVVFLHRLWTFSMKKRTAAWFLSGYLVVACLTTAISDTLMSAAGAAPILRSFSREVHSVFVIEAAVDLGAAVILWRDLEHGRTTFGRTRLATTQYTIAIQLVATLTSLGCLTAYMPSSGSLFLLGTHYTLGRLYTNALVATLNARALLGPTDRPTPSSSLFAVDSEGTSEDLPLNRV